MRDTIALVVTSEKTWPNLAKYCFNEPFQLHRSQLDLAVVLNGPCDEALSSIRSVSPEFLFVRPNYGLDPAGFDYRLKRIPLEYANYLLLHDDHWFLPSDWFTRLRSFAAEKPEVHVFGNLVKSSAQYHPSMDTLSKLLGYEGCSPDDAPFFVQGMAGLYRSAAIQTLLALDGIPHIHRNVMPVAWLAERLVTALLLRRGLGFAQIPPGYERFLKHKDHPPSQEFAYTLTTSF